MNEKQPHRRRVTTEMRLEKTLPAGVNARDYLLGMVAQHMNTREIREIIEKERGIAMSSSALRNMMFRLYVHYPSPANPQPIPETSPLFPFQRK